MKMYMKGRGNIPISVLYYKLFLCELTELISSVLENVIYCGHCMCSSLNRVDVSCRNTLSALVISTKHVLLYFSCLEIVSISSWQW